MAYSAWCDTAVHTKWWITGTGSAVNRLSEVMDDNASGVEFDDDPGVYEPWTSFMTETVVDAIYLIHISFAFMWLNDVFCLVFSFMSLTKKYFLHNHNNRMPMFY